MPRKLWVLVLSSVLLLAPIASSQSGTHRTKTALSQDFAISALTAIAQVRDWEMHLAYTLKNGYPLSEYWVISDRDHALDALQFAVSAAKREADRAALVQLVQLFGNVQSWSDARLEDKRNLRLANYYMSALALDNDELFQQTISCTNFLISMLASGRLAEETICR
jgi:hypothetical protein